MGPASKLLTVGVLTVLMRVFASVQDGVGPEDASGYTVTVLGFLLLAAFLSGKAAADLGLPRVTGYVLFGLAVGPGTLGVVGDDDLERFRPVGDIAISLIALSAGGEVRLGELRRRWRQIAGIVVAEMVAVFLAVGSLVLLLAGTLPFTAGHAWPAVVAIAAVFASIAVANSPSVTIAVIDETRSRGVLSSTIMNVTVVMDVVVVVAFAVSVAVARSVLGGADPSVGPLGLAVVRGVGGSLLLGLVVGGMIALYLRWVAAERVLFVLGAAFVIALLAGALHLEPLLVSLVAGVVVVNSDPRRGRDFLRAVQSNSLVFYALFFSLAGAHIRPRELGSLLPIVLLFTGVRAGAAWLGTRVGASWSGAPDPVRRYAWLGLISQAGVTLGMVSILAREFPTWGAEIHALFLAMIAVHEIVGPVLLQWGLGRAGEIGARDAARASP